jgi:Spy/CpxP family protein refolding chaperone
MNIQLMHGEFNSNEAIELITQMVHIKIKYHEDKINSQSNEEDIKTREDKIKRLQKELFELRKVVNSKTTSVKLEAIIKIE